MKISNETKVGALTAVAIVILILGFNFLKGRNLTERNDTIYSVFPDIKGLQVSNPVFIKGLQVGKISEMHEKVFDISDSLKKYKQVTEGKGAPAATSGQ